MAAIRSNVPYKDYAGTSRPVDAIDQSGAGNGPYNPLHGLVDANGNLITPAQDATVAALSAKVPTLGQKAMSGSMSVAIASDQGGVPSQIFTPVRGASIGLTVSPTATVTPVALPACTATCYRVRNPVGSASPVTWTLSITGALITPVLPVLYSAAGTGGTAGDKTIDAGGVEVIGLSAAQQTALAAGTLCLAAICPASGSATLFITPGTGI